MLGETDAEESNCWYNRVICHGMQIDIAIRIITHEHVRHELCFFHGIIETVEYYTQIYIKYVYFKVLEL